MAEDMAEGAEERMARSVDEFHGGNTPPAPLKVRPHDDEDDDPAREQRRQRALRDLEVIARTPDRALDDLTEWQRKHLPAID